MATAQATTPDAATQEVQSDLGKRWIGVPKYVGGVKGLYITKSSVKDTMLNDLGLVKIEAGFDIVAQKGWVQSSNLKPRRASRRENSTGEYESGFISDDKEIPTGWTKQRSKNLKVSPRTKRERLAYVTINGLKFGAKIGTGGSKAASAEKYRTRFGFEWATATDLDEIILFAEFPKVPKVIAPNGLTYPIAPTKINDSSNADLTIFDIAYTKNAGLEFLGLGQV